MPIQKSITKFLAPYIFCLLFCIIFAIPNLASAASEPTDFYYYYNEKIPLEINREMITVRFKEHVSKSQVDAVVKSDLKLKSVSLEKRPKKLKSLLVKEGLSKDDIKQTVRRLNKLSEVEFCAPVFKHRNTDLILMDEFVVRFSKNITEQAIAEINKLYGVAIVRKSPYRHNRYIMRVINPKDKSAVEVANIYNNLSIVKYASPSFAVIGGFEATYPNDTYFDQQWPLDNRGAEQDPPAGTLDADMDAPEGWHYEVGISNVVIAIIDSGTDIDHEDLAGNIWINQAELNGTTGVDDDGNGYIDDINGWDFESDDYDPSSTNAHGTACAGLAGAIGNNSKGVAGVCWSTSIMPLKIGTSAPITSAAADAIDYASANGADVLSNSWSVPPDPDLTNAIQNAKNNGRNGKGCVLLVASGNGYGAITYPATLSETIAVGATDEDDVKWGYSNYGSQLNVVAPSSDGLSTILWTTDISGSGGYNSGSTSEGDATGDYTKWFSGTSAATPQAAGLAGLILSVDPSLTSDDVQDIIETTADDLGDSGWDQYYGWGRINIYEALKNVCPLGLQIEDSIDPNSCGIDPTDPNNNTITYTLIVTHKGIDPNDPNDPNNTGDITDITLVDYLPSNIDPLNVIVSDSGYYNQLAGTVTWNLGTLSPGDSNSVTLTVTILEGVEPCGEIKNIAEVFALDTSVSTAIYTPVCCYGGDIIYVDSKANGLNVGLSWQTAYTELSSALNRAAKGCGNEIWVAGGVYTPTNTGSPSVSLELVDDVEVYGGFSGYETGRNQRNFVRNKTYLSGDISATDNDPNSDYVVSADDGITDSATLDGFVICRGVKAGVHLYDQAVMDGLYDPNTSDPNCDISPNIVNCYITNNEGDGIHGQLADPNIYACIIADNGGYGIIDANSPDIEIDRCVIRNNTLAGIHAHVADSGKIINCFIYQNGDGILCYGINGTEYVTIRNNTIVYNDGLAVEALIGSTMPVVNSILWGNSDPNQIVNCLPDRCFIDVDSVSGINYNTDPGFAYTEPNACNYHLAADSNCINAGLTAGIPASEKDIDSEVRIYNSLVDIGADEVTSCNDVVSSVDHNGDGIVNLIEFNLLANAWITYDPCSPPDTGDPNFLDDIDSDHFDKRCDYEDDSMIDILDLQEFASDWLWTACWKDAAIGTWLETASTGSSSLQVPGTTSTAMSMSFSSMAAEPTQAPTLSPATQLLQAVEMLDFLNKIYNDDLKQQIDENTWDEFMKYLEGWVGSLAEDYLNDTE